MPMQVEKVSIGRAKQTNKQTNKEQTKKSKSVNSKYLKHY